MTPERHLHFRFIDFLFIIVISRSPFLRSGIIAGFPFRLIIIPPVVPAITAVLPDGRLLCNLIIHTGHGIMPFLHGSIVSGFHYVRILFFSRGHVQTISACPAHRSLRRSANPDSRPISTCRTNEMQK